jgi:hypothetical protein
MKIKEIYIFTILFFAGNEYMMRKAMGCDGGFNHDILFKFVMLAHPIIIIIHPKCHF